MNILTISCIHNDVETLMNFIDKIALLNFDIILSPGDFCDYSLPKGFTNLDIGQLIIEELNSLGKPLLVVPGTWDKDLIDFFEKEKISIHGKGRIINKVGFYGFGGAKTPFNTPFEPSEDEIYNGLRQAYNDVKNCKIKIQLTHAPPAKTKVDLLPSGAHVGSESVREFIEKNQPDVAACSHIHEAKGIDEIGKTKIINSGRFPEGYCGLISIKKEKVEIKIVNLV